MLKTFVLVLTLATTLMSTLGAQTKIPIIQILPPPSVTNGTLLIITPIGGFQLVDLGACFTVVAPVGLAHATLGFNPGVAGCGNPVTVPNYADAETPGGTVNGINVTFALANAPSPTLSLQLIRNGLTLKAAVDYTLAGNTITFLAGAIPQTGDILLACYRH